MKKRSFLTAVIALLMLMGLSGCSVMDEVDEMLPSKQETFERTTLTALKDGTVKESVIDQLNESYYSSEDLKKMIDETVLSYCAQEGEGAVLVDAFSSEEGRVVLDMTYRSAADYAAYNNVIFFNGSVLEAQLEGFLFNHDFRAVADGTIQETKISAEEPLSHKEYTVLVTDASHAVRVPGKIKYVSANALIQDEYTMIPGEPEESVEQVLVLPSSAVYVQEKTDDETAAELDRALIYILYDY